MKMNFSPFLMGVAVCVAWIIGGTASSAGAQDASGAAGEVDLDALPGGPGPKLMPLLSDGKAPARTGSKPVALSASWTMAEGSKRGRISVRAQLAPSFHIYSITQPKGGALPSKIEVVPSAHFELRGDFAPDHAPEVTFPMATSAGGDTNPFDVNLEEHRGEVVWSAPIEILDDTSPETVKIEVRFSGQVCEDLVGCLPPMTRVPLEVKFAGLERSEYKAKRSHVVMKGLVAPQRVAPGGKFTLQITATPEAPFYIYAHDVPLKISRPTVIGLDRSTPFQPGKFQPSAAPYENKDTGDDQEPVQWYYKEPVTWSVEFNVPADTKPGDYDVRGKIGYQTCKQGQCDLPKGAEFSAIVTVGTGGSSDGVHLVWTDSDYVSAAELFNSDNERVQSSGAKGESQRVVDNPWKDKSLAAVLALAFLGGLILNVMPCVLPVIGLKVMSFVQQASESRLRIFALNAWFSFGLLLVFWVLATIPVALSLLGKETLGWGGQFQYAGFNITLASVVFVFGLSFLGVWEIPIPGFVGAGTASHLAEREGYTGAFFKGILATLLATPCAGPLMGPAVGWAVAQPPLVTYAVFTALGLGMASPMIVIGAFPSLVKMLPKPGLWMETFKQLMGFVLLATVVWMFSFLKATYHVPTLLFLLGLGVACWMVGHVDITAGFWRKARGWSTALTVAAAFGYAAFGMSYGTELDWQPFSRATLETNRREGKTVLVDFTANWCLTCKANERLALNRVDTKKFVEKNGIVTLKADKTETSPEIDQLLRELGNEGTVIPFYAIYPADGSEPITLQGIITQETVVSKLKEATERQSKSVASRDPL